MKGIDIKKFPEHVQRQIQEKLNAENIRAKATRDTDTKQERGKHKALGMEAQSKEKLVDINCPVLVRITRIGTRRLDDDNLSGGCKGLRDFIASALGRKGDSEKDGMIWEYVQEKGEPETVIEIFEQEDSKHDP